jgi:hypothetical protein
LSCPLFLCVHLRLKFLIGVQARFIGKKMMSAPTCVGQVVTKDNISKIDSLKRQKAGFVMGLLGIQTN